MSSSDDGTARTMGAQPQCGSVALDQDLLEVMTRLWEGPLRPEDLEDIELTLRAFLAHDRLYYVPHLRPYDTGDQTHRDQERPDNPLHSDPFAEVLDYEFEPGEWALQDFNCHNQELCHRLKERVWSQITSDTPAGLSTIGQYHAFYDRWLEGDELDRGRIIEDALNPELFYDNAPAEHLQQSSLEDMVSVHIDDSIRGLIGLHERRCSVYGRRRLTVQFDTFLQSEWPEHLFEKFGDSFRREAELLRGPGDPLPLPPFILMVLSRAERRSSIPGVLKDLREEFAADRKELWMRIHTLIDAETRKQQREALRELMAAGEHLFEASGGLPESYSKLSGAMSIFIDAGTMNMKALLRGLAEKDLPKAAVSRVGFTKRLGKMMKEIQSNAKVLRKHLEPSERRNFGMDR